MVLIAFGVLLLPGLLSWQQGDRYPFACLCAFAHVDLSTWNTFPSLLPSRMCVSFLFQKHWEHASQCYPSLLQCNYFYTRLSPVQDYEFLNGKGQVLSIFHNPQPPCPLWGLVKQDLKWYIHGCLWVLNISVWKSKILILSPPEKVGLALLSVFSNLFGSKSNLFSWMLSFYLLTNFSYFSLRITQRAFWNRLLSPTSKVSHLSGLEKDLRICISKDFQAMLPWNHTLVYTMRS